MFYNVPVETANIQMRAYITHALGLILLRGKEALTKLRVTLNRQSLSSRGNLVCSVTGSVYTNIPSNQGEL